MCKTFSVWWGYLDMTLLQIDIFGIRRYNRVRNDEVLQRTGLTSLSHLLSRRRISVFGHVVRLDDVTLANWLFSSASTYHSTDLLTAVASPTWLSTEQVSRLATKRFHTSTRVGPIRNHVLDGPRSPREKCNFGGFQLTGPHWDCLHSIRDHSVLNNGTTARLQCCQREHVSGAWAAKYPLTAHTYFYNACSSLRSRSAHMLCSRLARVTFNSSRLAKFFDHLLSVLCFQADLVADILGCKCAVHLAGGCKVDILVFLPEECQRRFQL